MWRIVALMMLALLFGYGLIRIGVGCLLLAQALELIQVTDFADALAEVKRFTAARADKELVAFSVSGYCVYIMLMGLLLASGAVGVFRYKLWGFMLLGLYLLMHAALFVNYQEINPKLFVLALQALMLVVLLYLRPPRAADIVK
ncbi:hypothetical protein [Rheinheimera sp.]|uniref:hypothetical protein n=1 Tax=Rheinheimera sp. TaxID=1869214 RepID=UPI002639A5FA|nr:hypothetical protein [Rheinheimera sp.]MCA1928361.1 hypothetical protein [Rheinheimera sp.]